MDWEQERIAWIAVFGILIAFAIPWFLWRNSDLVLGLPLWVWWHVGWMVLTAVAFWVFSGRAWDRAMPGVNHG